MDKFEEKLKEWYGKTLDRSKVELLAIDEVENDEIFAKTYMVAEEVEGVKRVEFARIFMLSDTCEISIDLKVDDITDLNNLIKIVRYAHNITGEVIPF